MGTNQPPPCSRTHGDTAGGIVVGALLIAALLVWTLKAPTAACEQFRRHGYYEVPSVNRAFGIVEEFRNKTSYKPTVRLYGSVFHEAYEWTDRCDGEQIIVVGLEHLNTWSDAELRGILAHEFGHKLVDRHRDPTPPAKTTEEKNALTERNQREADGYGIELFGEDAFRAYRKKYGWTDDGISTDIARAKNALADLRKRAPLI